MTTVYLVQETVPYDSTYTLGVYSTLEAAKIACPVDRDTDRRYFVVAFEVDAGDGERATWRWNDEGVWEPWG